MVVPVSTGDVTDWDDHMSPEVPTAKGLVSLETRVLIVHGEGEYCNLARICHELFQSICEPFV